MDKSIEQLGLSYPSLGVLKRLGVQTIEQLADVPIDRIINMENTSPNTVKELKDAILFCRKTKRINEIQNIDKDEKTTHLTIRYEDRNILGESIDHLKMSPRSTNALHRAGLHTVEDLLFITKTEIASIRNIGTKSLEEINDVITNLCAQFLEPGTELTDAMQFKERLSEEDLGDLSRFPVSVLLLSARTYNCLIKKNASTLDKVASLLADTKKIDGLGKKGERELQEKYDKWVEENYKNQSAINTMDSSQNEHEDYVHLVDILSPIFKLSPQQLSSICSEEGIDATDYQEDIETVVRLLLNNPRFVESFSSFFLTNAQDGLIEANELINKIKEQCAFDAQIVIEALNNNQLCCERYKNYYLDRRKHVLDYLDEIEKDKRKIQIIRERLTSNRTLQSIADDYGITRERIRQIVKKFVTRVPKCFEDFFEKPFCYFDFSLSVFNTIFGFDDCTVYNFLSTKHKSGNNALSEMSIEKYPGPFKTLITEYFEQCEKDRHLTKMDLAYRVLLESDVPLSIDAFNKEYQRLFFEYGRGKVMHKNTLQSVHSRLRVSKNIVFNKDNEIRYIELNAKELINQIDFDIYRDLVISADLVYRNNAELMDAYDIQDGYELFYVLKSWKELIDSEYCIRFRRVPTLIFGDGSEKEQALRLLRELSPVSTSGFFQAYEERYGVRMNSAQANLYDYVLPYLTNGMYEIDVKTIAEEDEPFLVRELKRRSIWFIEDLRNLFEQECLFTDSDAINRAAFARIGYRLFPSGYAIPSYYESSYDYFKTEIFNKDVVDLNEIDPRIRDLSVFISYLEIIRSNMKYIEVNPRIYMSSNKILKLFHITKDDIFAIRNLYFKLCNSKYFNGYSLWVDPSSNLTETPLNDLEKWEILDYSKKLKENRWFLTSILKTQEGVHSFRAAGTVILSKQNDAMNIADVCSWIVSKEGKMSIGQLQDRLFQLLGAKIEKYALVGKIRERHLWDTLITDQIDDYISSLLGSIDEEDMDDEDFFAEEF